MDQYMEAFKIMVSITYPHGTPDMDLPNHGHVGPDTGRTEGVLEAIGL